MVKILTSLFAFWPKLPRELRVAISAAVFIAILILPIMVVYSTLKDGSLQNKLGLVATKSDIDTKFDEVKAETAQHSVLIVGQALSSYTDSLAQVKDSLEEVYLDPIVSVLQDLQQRMEGVERRQGHTNNSLDEINDKSAEQIRQLRHISEADDTRVDIEDLLIDMEERISRRMDEKLQEIKDQPARRTSKAKM